MPPEYTPAVRRALEIAGNLARLHQAAAVEPVHLLQALLQEEEGRPWGLLVEAGAEPGQLRAAFAAAAPAPEFTGSLPSPGPLVEEILAHARELARTVSADGEVATELLLLALLRNDRSLTGRLEAAGLTFACLEEAILAAQGPPLRMDEPLELADWTEEVDTARLLDAAANRAREALRTLEDYCRFVLNDAVLSGELKQLRHALKDALDVLPGGLLLEARDTLGDVGTTLATEQERARHSLSAVVQAACKRLQEALRSLEEVGKLRSASLGEHLKQLRYQAYTLERALVLGAGTRQRLAEARLYVLLTGAECVQGLERTIREAAAGGAQVFQLREKRLADRELLERARRVRQWTRQAGALFILNDRADLARLAEADGVHLGQDDLSVRDARRVLGPSALIGVSTHEPAQLRQAVLDGASYVGIGPTFASQTKAFVGFAGLEFVQHAAATTTLPAFAIGGIVVANVAQVVAAGLRRVAVSRAVCQAEDPRAAAAALRQILDGG
jgi:thiamine-phosphate pyrophosphorylase